MLLGVPRPCQGQAGNGGGGRGQWGRNLGRIRGNDFVYFFCMFVRVNPVEAFEQFFVFKLLFLGVGLLGSVKCFR